VSPGHADLVGFMEFPKAEQAGETGRAGLTGTVHDKVIPKLDYIQGCAAVYAASIGASSIRPLMAGVQPIMVDTGHDIVDLLNEVSLALAHGGLAWVDRAKAKAAQLPQRTVAEGLAQSHALISSIEELEWPAWIRVVHIENYTLFQERESLTAEERPRINPKTAVEHRASPATQDDPQWATEHLQKRQRYRWHRPAEGSGERPGCRHCEPALRRLGHLPDRGGRMDR
jgi:nitrogen fixation protein NifX